MLQKLEIVKKVFREPKIANRPKEQRKETTGAEDEEPKPKYLQVNVRGENFWTTGELLAMAQDCERVFNDTTMSMSLNLYGENSLVNALWKLHLDENKIPNFEDVFSD